MPRYPQGWYDMSDYVVHFTKESNEKTPYDNQISILHSGVLRAMSSFGIARKLAHASVAQKAACFSEIPLHLISRLAERRGGYGIGFTKQFLLERGGGPIWYVERDGPAERAIQNLIFQALASNSPEASSIWTLTPFVDSTGDYATGTYRFEWEREWRHLGDLHFTPSDVAFLIIPEELHKNAYAFFQNAYQKNLGPAYFCPYIDPGWNFERLRETLSSGQHQL